MCFVMLGDAGQPLGFNSENRDAAHPATARRAAEKLDVLLRSDESFRVLASLGLATPFGPSLPKDLRPSPRAHDLALQEFHAAVPRLEELYRTLCITSLRGGNARVPWLIELPARESLLAELGFPILGAFSPNAAYDLYRLIPALKTPALAPQHPRFRQLLTEFVFAENEQWRFI